MAIAPLGQLLDEHGVAHPCVGTTMNRGGDVGLDQRHHGGHPGWVIFGETFGSSGVFSARVIPPAAPRQLTLHFRVFSAPFEIPER